MKGLMWRSGTQGAIVGGAVMKLNQPTGCHYPNPRKEKNMSDMPMKIYLDCYPCASQVADKDYQPEGTPYINAEQLVEELEGMKVDNHISDSEYNMALKDGHNYAIDAILEMLEE
jgi:hypothetical protein